MLELTNAHAVWSCFPLPIISVTLYSVNNFVSGLVEQLTYSMRFYMGFKFGSSPQLLRCFFCPAAVLQGHLLFVLHRKEAKK